jgi:hypothetical protein
MNDHILQTPDDSPDPVPRSLKDRILSFVFQKKTILFVLAVTFIVTVASMWHRYIYIDDCCHGEEAYWLAKEGVVKIKSFEGILGMENRVMVYHKLNILFGAAIVKVFGWSVYYLKLFTFAVYLLFFYVLYRFFKAFRHQYEDQRLFLTAVLLIFTSPLMVYLSFTYRPEMLVMFFGFLSYFFLEKHLQDARVKWLIFAGISAGLAFFTHLNGMIFPIAGAVLLLWLRKYKSALIFSIIAGITSLLYTYDLWQGNNFQIFVYQIKNWPTLHLGKTYLGNSVLNFITLKLINLLNEHQRFFWSEKVTAFSILFLGSLIIKFKTLKTSYRSLLIYTITLIVALSLTSSHIAERFMMYYYPFMAMITAIAIVAIFSKVHRYALKTGMVLLIALQFAFSTLQFVRIFRLNADYPEIQREVLSKIPDKDPKILAPDEFVFNGIEDHRLLSYHALKYYQDEIPAILSQDSILKRAAWLKADYIVLDYAITHDDHYTWFKDGIITMNPYYTKYLTIGNYIILKRIAD